MQISKLYIENFRLFDEIRFIPSNKINIITGPNGSGKSSLIESIFLLARNRSFRTSNHTSLINNGAAELILSANLKKDSGQKVQIGLKKSKKHTELYISGQKQKRVSDQARMIPVSIITANTQRLITDGPKNRRKFIDWSVFHVEHNYSDLVNSYNKILLQRNAALRTGQSEYRIWDNQLVNFGERIHQSRSRYFSLFQEEYSNLVKNIDLLSEINIKYIKGWNDKQELYEAIINRDDKLLGYTYLGPHRADLGFFIGNHPINDYLSNGQLKIFAIYLILTQLRLVQNIIKENPV